MTHAILNSSELKVGHIVDALQWVNRHSDISYQEMMRRYEFLWGFFKEVADDHGIKLPWTWYSAEKVSNKHRYTKYKSLRYLEPLGPTILVNHEVMTGAYLMHLAASTDNLAYSSNWNKVAKRFFMVDNPASLALKSTQPIKIGVISEKWRIIPSMPTNQLISKK